MSLLDQFLAIFEAEVKSYFRRAGSFMILFIFPFVFSGVSYTLGMGFQGGAVSLTNWFYQIIGFAMFGIAAAMTSSSAWYIKEGLLTGRLEYALASPISPLIIVAATSLASGLFSIFYFISIGLIATTIALGYSHLPYFFLSVFVLAISLLPVIGFNLIVAALSIIFRETDPFAAFVTNFVGAVSGLVYPLTLLPFILQLIGKAMPYFYAAEYTRATIQGYINVIFSNPFPFLFIYLFAGFLIYRALESRYIRKRGYYGW